MNNPAFQEMNDAREGLHIAWERAWKAIDPYIDECIKLETTETEINVLAYMARPNQWTDWPWAKELNAEIAKQVGERLYRMAMNERFTRVAQEQLKGKGK
jgi:hypothetical protein